MRTLSVPLDADSSFTDPLEVVLENISQGVYLLDPNGRVVLFNQQLCELLKIPHAFFEAGPTMKDLGVFQAQRGDFGDNACLVDANARDYVLSCGTTSLPAHYLRRTLSGLTLEVRSHPLTDGRIVRTYTDVTGYVQAKAARQRANELLEATQAIAKVGGWEIELLSGQVTWSTQVYRIFETTPEEFTPTVASTAPLFTAQANALIQASYQGGQNDPTEHDFEVEMLTLKGHTIWVHSRGTTLWEHGRPIKRTAIVQDITERRLAEMALRESETRWKLALESVGDGLWDLDVQSGHEYLSPSLLRMHGYDPDDYDLIVSEPDDRTHPDDLLSMQRDRQNHLDGLTPTYSNEHRVLCKNGSWKWVLSRGMVISRDEQGRALRMIGVHTDITERKQSEAMIWEQAHFDALTGLPNRRMLRERLVQELKKCRRDNSRLALLMIDLDRFKEVNDSLGHDRGDELLVQAAKRIKACVRDVDTVARMGGDEFTVLVTDLVNPNDLSAILPKILQTLNAGFVLGHNLVFVSGSIGVTLYPFDATEIEDMLKNADQALYAAKAAGRNRASYFTPALQESALLRAQLTHELRAALLAQQFTLVYQPIVHIATGAIHKAEALVRWQHPTRGLIPPAEFIPLAERSGLIVELGEWVFSQAVLQVKAWRTKLHAQFQISVNKSPVQFENPDPSHPAWNERLRANGLAGDSVVIEITEGLLLSTSESVVNQLLSLRDQGMQVSLDDFGTGYSSLSYLQKFDIDFIKIDQSFVHNLAAGSTNLVLCQAIIAMAHALDIQVIAEGVETAQQRDLLAASGCDFAQGYFYSKPVSAEVFEQLFAAPTQSP